MSELWIGYSDDDKNERITVALEELYRHVAVMGASGSGKTVFCKVIIEECIRIGIPVFAIDPQGDIVRLLIKGDPEQMQANGTPPELADEYFEKMDPVIFTPGTNDGIKLIFNPLSSFPNPKKHKKIDKGQLQSILSTITDGIISFIAPQYLRGQNIVHFQQIIYKTLEEAFKKGKHLRTLSEFATVLEEVAPSLDMPEDILDAIPTLQTAMYLILEGRYSHFLKDGVPLNIAELLEKRNGKKTPLYIFYLNVLPSMRDKQVFVQNLVNELFSYALTTGAGNYLLFIDEVKDYIPSGTQKPPCKPILQTFFTQARKYKAIGLIATQSPGSIDFNVLGQCNTRIYGKLNVKQDLERIRDFLASEDLKSLPKKRVGRFVLSQGVTSRHMKVRWLYSDHGEPIPAHELRNLMDKRTIKQYEKKIVKTPTQAIEQHITKTTLVEATKPPSRKPTAIERKSITPPPLSDASLQDAISVLQEEINSLPLMAHQILFDLLKYEKINEGRPPPRWDVSSWEYQRVKHLLEDLKLIRISGNTVESNLINYFRHLNRRNKRVKALDDTDVKDLLKKHLMFTLPPEKPDFLSKMFKKVFK